MRVVIGSDHAGFEQKERVARAPQAEGYEVTRRGRQLGEESVDYPDFAVAVAPRGRRTAMPRSACSVCGTGIGMAIAANKVHGVRAANVTDPEFAELARQHNDANVVTVPGAVRAGPGQRARSSTRSWPRRSRAAGTQRRVDKMDAWTHRPTRDSRPSRPVGPRPHETAGPRHEGSNPTHGTEVHPGPGPRGRGGDRLPSSRASAAPSS